MAKGFGGTLHWPTLMAIITHQMNVGETNRMFLVFDKNKGYTAYLGTEGDDQKYFETHDSALLALIIGAESVPGVADDY
jgi:hypothetical protein